MIVLSIIRGGGERISRKPITSPLRLSFPPSPSIFFLLSPPPPSGYLAPLRVYHCLAPPAPTRFLPPGNSRDTTLETSRRLASSAPVRWNSLSRRRNEFVRGDDERGDGVEGFAIREIERYGSSCRRRTRYLSSPRRRRV